MYESEPIMIRESNVIIMVGFVVAMVGNGVVKACTIVKMHG